MTAREPAAARGRGRILACAAAVLVTAFAADQLTKLWALSSLADGSSVPLLPSVSLRLAFNPGVAFSLGAGTGPVLALGVLLVLILLTVWIGWKIRRREPLPGILLLSVAAGGGWGNMYDRITRAEDGILSGHVVDFIAVDWFAIFNFGDVLAVCGITAWVLVGLFTKAQSADAGGIPRASETP